MTHLLNELMRARQWHGPVLHDLILEPVYLRLFCLENRLGERFGRPLTMSFSSSSILQYSLSVSYRRRPCVACATSSAFRP